MNALLVYAHRYITTKIRTYGDKVCTNFRGLSVPEDGAESEYFKVISMDSLVVYEKKNYLQVYLDNCVYKIVNIEMVDYTDDNPFETDYF